MKKEDEKINLLIDDHLVSVWLPETDVSREAFRVTRENLVDFIKEYFKLKG